MISIEVPAFKGKFLRSCIESVFAQTSEEWTLSLVWDGGDAESRHILEQLQQLAHPRIRVYFTENQGIGPARSFLTARSSEPYILPLDDDDVLSPRAVERFQQAARECPWASLIRARRDFIDEAGGFVDRDTWFPFGPRHYQGGMVTDVFNQAQPYLIRRSAYARTQGWRGFSERMGAGEDCDLFLQLEEVAHFELIDEVLYHYRLHDGRASHTLTPPAAFEMWRRLADRAIQRMGLSLQRVSDVPPFAYEAQPRPALSLSDVDFVILAAAENTAAQLRHCGVEEGAIVRAPPTALKGAWKGAGFRSTKRRLICFLGEGVRVRTRGSLESLVRFLQEADVDVVAPRVTPVNWAGGMRSGASGRGEQQALWPQGECLLLRREVMAATGGFDEHFVPASLQSVDLCLQARRRGFSCGEPVIEGVQHEGLPRRPWTSDELGLLQRKWRSYPALLDASWLETASTPAPSARPRFRQGTNAAS